MIDSCPEEFLQSCVRYKTQTKKIDSWLKLTPAERYQKEKKSWGSHDCSVWMRYGNSYASSDKPGCSSDLGCIEECRYYEDMGTVEDDEVRLWYNKEIGNRDYEQLNSENDIFIKAVMKEVKRQAEDQSRYRSLSVYSNYGEVITLPMVNI